MQYRFELSAIIGVVEDALAHPRSIEVPLLIENTGSERFHDLRQRGRARLDQPAGDHIGVDHRYAELLEPPRGRTLAGGQPAGERDDHGAVSRHVVPARYSSPSMITVSPQ